MSPEAVNAYWDLQLYAKPVLREIAELARMEERCTPADEMASIREELSQPVYDSGRDWRKIADEVNGEPKEEREFTKYQLNEHLYGSDNSQG